MPVDGVAPYPQGVPSLPSLPRPAAHGSLIYLHGVGGPRDAWWRPVTRSLGTLEVTLFAPTYDDLLTNSGAVHARRQAYAEVSATDDARRAYLARQQRLSDLVEGVGESTVMSWPASLPHPADIAERLPLTRMLRAPVFGLDQVGRYLDDASRRAAVLHRVTSTVLRALRPRVVIAHSLGSIVAWDLLADPRMEIDLLVTLGSPLAQSAVTVEETPFPYGRVGAWLNVVHLLDPVPAGRGLREFFPAACDAFLPPISGVGSPARGMSRLAAAVAGAMTSHLDSTYLASSTVQAAIRDALQPPIATVSGGGLGAPFIEVAS